MSSKTHDRPGNIGPARDAFFGRARELRDVASLLKEGARLVTVFGPGGIGKTRFAKRVAAEAESDGAWLVDWTSAKTERDALLAAARALGVSLKKSDDALDQIGRAIVAKKSALVVLDNCEQIVSVAAKLVSAWLDAAPEAKFLATSRETLHVTGERTFELEPLPTASDARALFVD
ncbi:MAG: AAA family ATPase, partial [Polyangiaceae bacterium]